MITISVNFLNPDRTVHHTTEYRTELPRRPLETIHHWMVQDITAWCNQAGHSAQIRDVVESPDKDKNDTVYTDEEQARYALIPGPVWLDHCDHPKESYVASFEVWDHTHLKDQQPSRYDLYVFSGCGWWDHGDEVCIRFGAEPQHYISPGTVGEFVFTTGNNWAKAPEYKRAHEILSHFGTFHWKKKWVERK